MLDVVIATIAGFVSFVSPCVLPLVPAYIGYMGGRVTNTVSAQVLAGSGGVAQMPPPSLTTRFSTAMHGVAFVLGFTFVFVTLGILGTAFVRQIGSTSTVEGMIGRIGGIFIIFFGLHFMGVLPALFTRLRRSPGLMTNPVTSIAAALLGGVLIAWGFTGTIALWDTTAYVQWTGMLALIVLVAFLLGMFLGGAFTRPAEFWNKLLNTLEMGLYADTRRQMSAGGSGGFSNSALMGVIFAAGWTPCIGPTLGLAMTMAANGGDIGHAAVLMTAYSLGLGVPFLITALMLDSAQGGLRRLKSQMATIKMVSGAFLVFIGVLIATGRLQDLSRQFSVQFGDFSIRVEECTIGALEGEIRWDQYGTCMSGDIAFRTLRDENRGRSAIGQTTVSNEPVSPPTISEIADVAGPVVGLAVGNRAPDFQTLTAAGEPMTLGDFRGQVVLLNFWFTSCAPCRIEMPEFQSAYEAHTDDGFVVLAVNYEETAEEILAFSEPLNLTFPLLLDEDSSIQSLYDVRVYPTTFIIDREGVIRYRSFGALTADQIKTLVEDALS